MLELIALIGGLVALASLALWLMYRLIRAGVDKARAKAAEKGLENVEKRHTVEDRVRSLGDGTAADELRKRHRRK